LKSQHLKSGFSKYWLTTLFAVSVSGTALAQTAPAPSNCTPVTVTSVTASSNDGNVPQNTLDAQLGSRWSALGKGQYLRADLGSSKSIDGAAIAWYQGNVRSSAYVLETSTDGVNFAWAASASSSGTTLNLETKKFTARPARYVRVKVNGNTVNDWASVTELRVCGASSTTAPAPTTGWTSLPSGTKYVTYPAWQLAKGAFQNIDTTNGKRYRMKYELMPIGNFDFRAGGKLPGMAGGTGPTGGSSATSGWSGRLMWNTGGRLSFYFYNVKGGTGGIDTGGYGTHWMWATDAKLKPGVWNTIEVVYDVNTGETIGYLNGVEKARQKLYYPYKSIDFMMFSTFFGGQGDQYKPVKTEYMSFRNMQVKKEY